MEIRDREKGWSIRAYFNTQTDFGHLLRKAPAILDQVFLIRRRRYILPPGRSAINSGVDGHKNIIIVIPDLIWDPVRPDP